MKALLTLISLLLLTSCLEQDKYKEDVTVTKTDRFITKWYPNVAITHIVDTTTGLEYISVYNGGIIQLGIKPGDIK